MTKIDIFSGFLGAGKTTLIKKLIAEAYAGEKLVLIENEFGEIGIDGGFMQDAGIEVTEMNSGCICCSLVGDFGKALNKVTQEYAPDRIIIEPSGVGKLSDVIRAVQGSGDKDLELNSFTTVVDAGKCKMYMRNFGEFFNNQVESAGCIILSRTAGMKEEKLAECVALLREKNALAVIITTPWDELDGKTILSAIEKVSLSDELLEKMRREHEIEEAEHEHEHHHHHDEHDEHDHEHEHHHDHDHDEHDHECGCEHDHDEHEHHHDHECGCGHHHHHHHHGHDADEVFDEFGVTTAHKYSREQIEAALEAIQNEEKCGQVLRSKGILEGTDGKWYQFDYVPGEPEVREGEPEATGMICVIGVGLAQDHIKELFGL